MKQSTKDHMKFFKLPNRKGKETLTLEDVIKLVTLEEKVILEKAEELILNVMQVAIEHFQVQGTIIVKSEGSIKAMRFVSGTRLEDLGRSFKAGMVVALDLPSVNESTSRKKYASDMPSGSALYNEIQAEVAAGKFLFKPK